MDKYQNEQLNTLVLNTSVLNTTVLNTEAKQRAKDLVSKMTLEEKVSQLSYNAAAIERLGIPSYNWWNESLHGVARAGTATMFPQAIGLAAMFDDEIMHQVASICSTEARAKYNASIKYGDTGIYKGLTMWSPNINIFRDPRWGRGQETYGECPFLTARLGVAFVEGLQGTESILKTAACAKHFAAHSGPEGIRHEFNAEVSMKDLEETYLPAFETLVKEAKVESVMGAYNRLNGEAACASTFLASKLKNWGFQGHFVSDCWAIGDFHTKHQLTNSPEESAALALKSGVDCNCGDGYYCLLDALDEELVTEEPVTESVTRLMTTRMKLGMFDASTPYDEISYDVVSCEAHKAVSQTCAEKSIVLLKNNGLLPLDAKKIKTIGVIGPNASSVDALRGNYYGSSDESVTFLQGIREAFDGRVYYSEGAHLFKTSLQPLGEPNDGIAEALTVAEHSDVVVLCVGLDATIEGEEGDTGNAFAAGDKTDLYLPMSQRILVDKVLEMNKPTIIVVAAGSAIHPQGDRADAILHAWYPGQMGGRALANILFGKVSPSGKLPVTFYESTELLPDFEDYSMNNRTYRYATGNILYPFGYGLTYTKTVCQLVDFNEEQMSAVVEIENIGTVDTDEVVQIYIKDCDSKWAVSNYSLCGFKRVFIPSGEKRRVTIQLSEKSLEVVNDLGERFVDSKHFKLFVGTSQPDALSRRLTHQPCVEYDWCKK